MFVTPASFDSFGRKLTHAAAERLSRNWTRLLFNGLLLILAGVLIFSIDWSSEQDSRPGEAQPFGQEPHQ
jgi:hypothetical protein